MILIHLFKDGARSQSLEPPFEIRCRSMADAIARLVEVELRVINYEWDRIILTRVPDA